MSDSETSASLFNLRRQTPAAKTSTSSSEGDTSSEDDSATSFEYRKPSSSPTKTLLVKKRIAREKIPDSLKIAALAGGLKPNPAGTYPSRNNNFGFIFSREYVGNETREPNFDYLPDVPSDPTKGTHELQLPAILTMAPYCECGSVAALRQPFRLGDRPPDSAFGEQYRHYGCPNWKVIPGSNGNPNVFVPKNGDKACNFKIFVDAPKYLLKSGGGYLKSYNKDKVLKRITTCFFGGGFAPQYMAFAAQANRCTEAIERGKAIIAEAKRQRQARRALARSEGNVDHEEEKEEEEEEVVEVVQRPVKQEKTQAKVTQSPAYQSPEKKLKTGYITDYAGNRKTVIDLTDNDVVDKTLL